MMRLTSCGSMPAKLERMAQRAWQMAAAAASVAILSCSALLREPSEAAGGPDSSASCSGVTQARCHGECVDLQTDARHCGMCDQPAAASGADSCSQGKPVCSAGRSAAGSCLHWKPVNANVTQDLRGIWGADPNNIWVVGTGYTLLRWDGSSWSSPARPAPAQGKPVQLFSVHGTSKNDVWAGGYWDENSRTRLLHWDGVTWETSELAISIGRVLSIWGPAASNVWVGPDNGSACSNWNGFEWRFRSCGTATPVNAMHGTSGADMWGAIGLRGYAARYDGTSWDTVKTIGERSSYGVWSASPNDVWLVGEEGSIQYWDGSSWAIQVSNTRVLLRSIYGVSSHDTWAVGDGGTALHWNGSQWLSTPTGTDADLLGVWAASPTEVWAVGNKGTLLHLE